MMPQLTKALWFIRLLPYQWRVKILEAIAWPEFEIHRKHLNYDTVSAWLNSARKRPPAV
jgi:hypothetical protein